MDMSFPPPRRHGSGCVCVVCGVCACVCGGPRASPVPLESPQSPLSIPEVPRGVSDRPVTVRRPPPAGGDKAGAVPLTGHHLLHLGADGLQVQGHPRARPADRGASRLVGEREISRREGHVSRNRLVVEESCGLVEGDWKRWGGCVKRTVELASLTD